MWVVVTPAMSAATADTAVSSSYHARVDGFPRQREGGGGTVDETVGGVGVGTPRGGDPACVGDEFGIEEPAPVDEPLHPGAQLGGEEPGVGGGQHRGEHPEWVAVQLVGVDGPKRRRHHRNG